MTEPGLIVAIVCSGIFGAALLWLGTYYLHRYIHLRCYELDHWFHFPVKGEDYGNEKAGNRSSSPLRHETFPRGSRSECSSSRSRHSRSRKRYMSPRDDPRNRREEKLRGSPKDNFREGSIESLRDVPRDKPRERRMDRIERNMEMPPAPAYHPLPRRDYYPQIEAPLWQPQMAAPMVAPMADPMVAPMVFPMGIPMIPLVGTSMIAPMAPPVAYNPEYERQYAGQYEQEPVQSPSDEGAEIEEPTPQLEHRRIDYIAEVDELPPFMREELQSSAEESSDDDDGNDDEIQQVPRDHMPRSVPRAATLCPQPVFWAIPPAPLEQRRTSRVRYAPYAKAVGQGRKLSNADRRRLTPSNASP